MKSSTKSIVNGVMMGSPLVLSTYIGSIVYSKLVVI